MNLENLKVNMTIKNYKEMCKLLDEKVKTGKSKQLQLQDWERYFAYHKDKNKFIIDEIYKVAKKKEVNSRNKISYIKYIEILILNLLAQSKNEQVYLSKNQMFKALKMVNDNYSGCKKRTLKLSNFTKIDEDIIHEWYDKTGNMLERNIETALNNLRKQSLISWNSSMTVCKLKNDENNNMQIEEDVKLDKYGEEQSEYKLKVNEIHRQATQDERRAIVRIERESMICQGAENKQQLILKGKWSTFKEAVKEQVLNELHIAYYYNCYDIVFTKEHVIDALKKVERKRIEQQLNEEIIKRNNNNAVKRHKKAVKECMDNGGELTYKNMFNHLSESYVSNCYDLSNQLLDISADYIVDDVRKIIL